MKRVLIVSLVVLELALVALVWWASTHSSKPTLEPGAPSGAETPAPVAPVQALDLEAEPAPADARREERPALPVAAPAAPAGSEQRISAVRGLVVFADDGKPVGGGEAYLTCTPATPTGFVPFPSAVPRDHSVRTKRQVPLAADGSFAFELAPGSQLHFLDVCAADEALDGPPTPGNAARRFARKRVGLEERLGSSPREVRIEVQRGIELAGSVVDAGTGRGIPGASVRVRSNAHEPLQFLTDPDGSFHLAGYERAELGRPCVLEFAHPDCIPAERTLQEEELAPGAAPLRIVLQRGLSVRGTLVDGAGRPLSGVALQIRATGIQALDLGATNVCSARSDEHGAFLVRGLPHCEAAVLSIEEQLAFETGVLAARRELGPLRADVAGVGLELETFGELVVVARLQGGFTLAPREFEVLVSGGTSRSVRVDPQRLGRVVRVPFGREVELVACAASRTSGARANAYVRGTRRVRLDPHGDVPQPFVIELDETGERDFPAPAPGTREFELSGPAYLAGAVDLELVDAATDRALDGEVWVSLAAPGSSVTFGTLRAGRVRVRGVPGTYPIEVETQDRLHHRFDLVIPAEGLGHETWRVGSVR